ncbi:TetR/AcrR family transcriptional regulator [Corynebacterium propinquum]
MTDCLIRSEKGAAPVRADAQANREAIIRASHRLFRQQGIDVTFRAIAAEAEVGVATVHRNFPDRWALILAVGDYVYAQHREIIEKYDASWDDDPWQAWTNVVVELVEQGIGPLSEQVSRYAEREDLVEQFASVVRNRDMQPFEKLLAKAAHHGFVSEDLHAKRFIITIGVLSRKLTSVASDIMPDHQRWMTQLVLAGLAQAPTTVELRRVDPE